MKKRVLCVFLALAMVIPFVACASNFGSGSGGAATAEFANCIMPEDLQTCLEKIANGDFGEIDVSKENLQKMIGLCERTLTQQDMDHAIADFAKAGKENDNSDITTASMLGLLSNIKGLNLELNTISDCIAAFDEAEQKENPFKEGFLNELSDEINLIHELGLIVSIDSLASNNALSLDAEKLKIGITQDFINALALTYLRDKNEAAKEANILLNTLREQWVQYDNEEENAFFAEGVKEVTPDEEAQFDATDADMGVYFPEGGALGDLLTDEEKEQALKNDYFSNVPNEESKPLVKTENEGTDYNAYLKDLLKKSGIKREELLKRSNIDIPQGWQGDQAASIDKRSGKLIVVTKKKVDSDNQLDINSMLSNSESVYPGSILYANKSLTDGRPEEVSGLKRSDIKISSSLPNTKSTTIKGENFSSTAFEDTLEDFVKEFKKSGEKTQIGMQYSFIDVSSEKQLEGKLGVSGPAKTWQIDVEACAKGTMQTSIIHLQQIYFTVSTDAATANQLISPNQKDLSKQFNTDENGNFVSGAYVRQVNYGRQLIIKLETNSCSKEVKEAWKSAFLNGEQSQSAAYKELLKNTKYSVCVYGGSADTSGELIKVDNMSKIREIIAKDKGFDGNFKAVPISYSTYFIDTGARAQVNQVSSYIETTVDEIGPTLFEMDSATWYYVKEQELVGRKITGITNDGKLQLGNWEKIWSASTGSHKLWVPAEYAEFGYSFDIRGGTDWPYSDVFWRSSRGVANNIFVDLGGGCRSANIEIKVNGNTVVYHTNCSKHKHKDWSRMN